MSQICDIEVVNLEQWLKAALTMKIETRDGERIIEGEDVFLSLVDRAAELFTLALSASDQLSCTRILSKFSSTATSLVIHKLKKKHGRNGWQPRIRFFFIYALLNHKKTTLYCCEREGQLPDLVIADEGTFLFRDTKGLPVRNHDVIKVVVYSVTWLFGDPLFVYADARNEAIQCMC